MIHKITVRRYIYTYVQGTFFLKGKNCNNVDFKILCKCAGTARNGPCHVQSLLYIGCVSLGIRHRLKLKAARSSGTCHLCPAAPWRPLAHRTCAGAHAALGVRSPAPEL